MPLLQKLPKLLTQTVVARLQKQFFKAGERVVDEGAPLTALGIVCEGELEVFALAPPASVRLGGGEVAATGARRGSASSRCRERMRRSSSGKELMRMRSLKDARVERRSSATGEEGAALDGSDGSSQGSGSNPTSRLNSRVKRSARAPGKRGGTHTASGLGLNWQHDERRSSFEDEFFRGRIDSDAGDAHLAPADDLGFFGRLQRRGSEVRRGSNASCGSELSTSRSRRSSESRPGGGRFRRGSESSPQSRRRSSESHLPGESFFRGRR